MSDLLNIQPGLTAKDSFVVKTSETPTFKYLPLSAFQTEVQKAMLNQENIYRATLQPLVIPSFSAIETLVFLDFVSASVNLEIDLPAPQFVGQRVEVSINVISGTTITTITVKDDSGNTLFTINPAIPTPGFIVDEDLTWKRL